MTKQEVIKILSLIKSTVFLGNRKFLDALDCAIELLEQPEPCKDAVSRQAAIGAISSMFASTPTQMDMKEDCLGIIENLPSAQPEHNPDDERKIADLHKMVNYLLSQQEQRWIPVSERLPEPYIPVLISAVEKDRDIVECGMTRNIGIIHRKPEWITADFGFPVKVVAWMSLPEPYREEGERHE